MHLKINSHNFSKFPAQEITTKSTIDQLLAQKQQLVENELYRKFENRNPETQEEMNYLHQTNQALLDVDKEIQDLRAQQQKPTGYFGWWRGNK